jgi:hypothetical protein
MEAESLPLADISPGDSRAVLESSAYSASFASRLIANSTGDYITYGPLDCSANLVGPVWDVQLRAQETHFAGTLRMSYGPSSNGPWLELLAPQDFYSATPGVRVRDLGGIVFQNAPTFIQFTVVGKNAASTGYNFTLDWLEFRP